MSDRPISLENLDERTAPPAAPVLVSVVLDESGSMASVWAATVAGFNEYVDGLRRSPVPTRLGCLKFDTEYRRYCAVMPVANVPPMTTQNYAPRGGTALLDAVVKALGDADAEKRPDERALVVVITDGEENSSKAATLDQVKAAVAERAARGDWTFVFLGANVDAFKVGASLGAAFTANASQWKSNDAGTLAMYRNLAGATMAYASNQAKATATFWASPLVNDLDKREE